MTCEQYVFRIAFELILTVLNDGFAKLLSHCLGWTACIEWI